MKPLFPLLMLLFVALFSQVASAEQRTISADELPAAAQNYIHTYFPDQTIKQVVVNYNPALESATYKVDLTGGYELTFDTAGHWKELDGNTTPLPQAAIPQRIWEYVEALTPKCSIQEIEAENEYYRVELSNETQLLFNPMGKFLAKE